jgi:hypothetical protein
MSHQIIQQLFEAQLNVLAQAQGLAVAWPNTIYEPDGSSEYLRCFTLPAETASSDLAGEHEMVTGVFQVTHVIPAGAGTGRVGEVCEALRAKFPIYEYLQRGAFKVQVMSKPQRGPMIQGDGEASVPISISYRADTF